MKPIAIALALMLAPQGAGEEEAAAGAVIDRLHVAAAAADGATYFDLFTPTARFIGTDAGERWTISEFQAYAAPYFAQGRGWTYAPVERTVTIAPIDCRCVASFDEVLTNEAYGVVRGSGVLIRTEAGWKVEQYVLSFTVPNDAAREVKAVIDRMAPAMAVEPPS